MSILRAIVYGMLRDDGTLALEGKPELPPGRVKVLIEPARASEPGEPGWWEILQQIKIDQQARGYRGRTREEIDADLAAERAEEEEYEERWRQIWSQTQPSPPKNKL